jgi:hypothetical protein
MSYRAKRGTANPQKSRPAPSQVIEMTRFTSWCSAANCPTSVGMTQLDDLKRFFDILGVLNERLGGARLLCECSGKLSWPQRGVYFFMEDGEVRSQCGMGPRIVRVGTHALTPGSRTTLWQRLSNHRGSRRSGGGNHRGSIFRLIIGTALIDREGHRCPTWDDRRSSAPAEVRARELALEREVSKTIGAMRFVAWHR